MNTPDTQYLQKTERLTDAFRLFNTLSENLTQSYLGLEEQVAQLNRELALARNERLKTLVEKEKLAARLQQILAALPAAVVVLDGRDRIIDCNQLALDFLGEPLLGRAWSDVTRRSLTPLHDTPTECCLKDGRVVTLTRNSLHNESGQIVLLADVSETRTLQAQLTQQKHLSAMGEMVASMAHQVRTPLATAILYASQMHKPALSDDKRRQFSQKILERLQYLERQVNDMLVFAKQGKMAMQSFSLTHLLASLSERLDETSVDFSIDRQTAVDRLVGNEDALCGALTNILNNALEAGADSICLTVSAAGGQLTIDVVDNGSGIAPSCQARLFEPFFTTKPQGTGLGLAVVDSVIRAHGGRIECRSEAGRGTIFSLSLSCMLLESIGLSSATADGFLTEEHHETV